MARTTKKRAKQLKHDKFRDTTFDAYGRLSHRFEGRGRTILYAVGGLVALIALILIFSWWRERRADEARFALGKAIEIADAPVSPTPQPNQTGPSFTNERARAQRAVEAFQKVQNDYGSPYSEMARYFAAANLLTLDRPKGLSELETLAKSGDGDVAARSKFALAQAREADAQYDAAASLYQELLNDKNKSVFEENTLKLRLASVYEKQGKKDEAAGLLFQMIEAARKAQGKDGKPLPQSTVTRAAADKLQELSPERYAQLPPEPVTGGSLPFGQ